VSLSCRANGAAPPSLDVSLGANVQSPSVLQRGLDQVENFVMKKRSFDNAVLDQLRLMPVPVALDALKLHWKVDRDFAPIKDKQTTRLHVSVGNGVFELLVTGPKWFDTRVEIGGGGAIDLAMHLFQLSFVDAVKRLNPILKS
jgi:hypothetical protein